MPNTNNSVCTYTSSSDFSEITDSNGTVRLDFGHDSDHDVVIRYLAQTIPSHLDSAKSFIVNARNADVNPRTAMLIVELEILAEGMCLTLQLEDSTPEMNRAIKSEKSRRCPIGT